VQRRSWSTHGGVADVRVHASQIHRVPDDHEGRREEHVQGTLLGLEREVAREERREGADDIRWHRAQLKYDRAFAGVDGTNDGGLRGEVVRRERKGEKQAAPDARGWRRAGRCQRRLGPMRRNGDDVQEADTLNRNVVEEEDESRD